MRKFTLVVSLPAFVILVGLGLADRTCGNRRLWGGIMIGSVAGLIAAVGYDIFRLPFVFAYGLGLHGIVPALQLFKVFPRFGAMLLGQSVEQQQYSLAAHLLGWAYHFSNGLTFGIMYLAVVGDARKHHWVWAVVMAVGLELGMLLTPYPAFFGIRATPTFVVVTLTAHLVFGVVLGLLARKLALKFGS